MNLRLLCLLLVTASSARAQSAPNPPAFATAGAFIAVSVPDLRASSQWYAWTLGMSVVMQPPPGADSVGVAILEGGGLIVELIRGPAAVPAERDPLRAHGIFKAGIIVTDYDRTLATLRERGAQIAFGPFPAQGGQRANFIIRDNAGNLLQFFGSR